MKVIKGIFLVGALCFLCSCTKKAEKKEIIDIAGDTVLIPVNPSKVVARTANSTSFMVAMGMKDKIVGTMDAIAANTWSKKFMSNIDEIPSYHWEPSIESLYEVDTDFVLLADPSICREFRSKGITAITYKQYSSEEIVKSVHLLGDIFGEDAKKFGEEWLEYYNDTLTSINNHIKDIDYEDRSGVYYIYGQANKGIYRSTGGNTINDEMIKLAGGRNVLENYSSSITKFTAEEVLNTNPDYIFVGGVYQNLFIEQLYDEEVWKEKEAIKKEQVYNIPLGFIPWDLYGVEFPLLLKYMCNKMYPDYQFDIIPETKAFMKKFYQIDLTDEEIQYMIKGLDENGERYY